MEERDGEERWRREMAGEETKNEGLDHPLLIPWKVMCGQCSECQSEEIQTSMGKMRN